MGGHVPLRDENLQTSVPGVFVAGDLAGVEEASSAMVEGRLAGLCAAQSLGYDTPEFMGLRVDCVRQLTELRKGPTGEKIRNGLAKAGRETLEGHVC